MSYFDFEASKVITAQGAFDVIEEYAPGAPVGVKALAAVLLLAMWEAGDAHEVTHRELDAHGLPALCVDVIGAQYRRAWRQEAQS